MSFLISVVAFIVALGILITVHEFGHFWVARRLGVKVLRFSIGFGKPLWQRVAGVDRTEYVIAAIPLGGYVKMLDEAEGEVPAEELARAFNRQRLAVRTAIVVAGPLFNFIFAIFAYWVIYMVGIDGIKPMVGEVPPQTPAAMAGLQKGDLIIEVADRPVATWGGAAMEVINGLLSNNEVALLVRDEQEQTRQLLLAMDDSALLLQDNQMLNNIGLQPWRPILKPVIGRIIDDGPAARAGLTVGDRVISVDGNKIENWSAWVKYLRARPGQRIAVVLDRGGVEQVITLRPEGVESDGGRVGRIGAAVSIPVGEFEHMRAVERYGPARALYIAVIKVKDMSALMLNILGKMVVGKASVENISGPISIAQYAGESAQVGIVPFLSFLALVSISLGVLNLLPVPLLDGGHLLYYAIEAVKGSPLSDAAMMVGQRFGIAALLTLMLLAFYNDLARLIGG